jgi:4-hydroxybenzoate polyprenyltransferase
MALAVGWQFGLRGWFLLGLAGALGCAVYHYTLIRHRERMPCFAAFKHNNWLGAAVFAGIALDYLLA